MNGLGQRQRGVVAVVVAIALLALLAMAGFALDSGHVMLNKSRLQNTVDAAALSAAKVLDLTGSEDQAGTAARSVFDLNAASQPELARAIQGADLILQFSNTLEPWAPGTTPAKYVRVVAQNFTMWTSFLSLVGVDDTSTAASAVSGPSPPFGVTEGYEICDIAPMMVCADLGAGAAGDWGYSRTNVTVLKYAAPGSPNVGPGNFQLIRLGGPGGNIVRDNAAGGYGACADMNGTLETQTGNVVGPLTQGINTRFGQYQGPVSASDYPPDKVTVSPTPNLTLSGDQSTVLYRGQPVTHVNQLPFNYANYESQLANGPYQFQNGKPRRREIAVPFANCSEPHQGQSTLPVVGLGCFFLLQPAVQQGNNSQIYTQFIGSCAADGTPGPVPDPNPAGGPAGYKIVLHNDPLSPDS